MQICEAEERQMDTYLSIYYLIQFIIQFHTKKILHVELGTDSFLHDATGTYTHTARLMR